MKGWNNLLPAEYVLHIFEEMIKLRRYLVYSLWKIIIRLWQIWQDSLQLLLAERILPVFVGFFMILENTRIGFNNESRAMDQKLIILQRVPTRS